jgi:hypothetical protein
MAPANAHFNENVNSSTSRDSSIKENKKNNKFHNNNNNNNNNNRSRVKCSSDRKVKKARLKYNYNDGSKDVTKLEEEEFRYSSSRESHREVYSDSDTDEADLDSKHDCYEEKIQKKTKLILLTLLAAGMVQEGEYSSPSSIRAHKLKQKTKRGRPRKDEPSLEEEKHNDSNNYTVHREESKPSSKVFKKEQQQQKNVNVRKKQQQHAGSKSSRIPKGATEEEEKKIRAEYASVLRVKKMNPWHRLKTYFTTTHVGERERAFLELQKIKKFEYLDILVVSFSNFC